MVRPLWFDLSLTILPLMLAAGAWGAGRCFYRLPKEVSRTILVLILFLIPLPFARFILGPNDPVSVALNRLGGITRLECGFALLLLGIVGAAPKRSVSSGFLATVCGIIGVIFLTECGGRLWWRFAAPATWNNTPDANGFVKQTTGFTCSAAATAMLLHRRGITMSEGELAYLSNTTFMGTTSQEMADALGNTLKAAGLLPTIQRVTFKELHRWQQYGLAESFVAQVNLPEIGGHAIFAQRVYQDGLDVIDPRTGSPQRMSRTEFERIWDGTALLIMSVQRVDVGSERIRE